MKTRLAIGMLLGVVCLTATAQQPMLFRDASASIERRVEDLVGRMTLEEKVGQMQHQAKAIPRLDIPEYNWWNECLHGVARNGVATVFPQAIGMAATWNPELIHAEAEVIAAEARAKHHEDARNGRRGIYSGLTFWSPNINIFRDPRWGRGQETYGEDPFLTSRIGVAFVRGLQGDDPKHFKVISTPKHYAVHSGPEPTRHSFDARTTNHDLYETYLPAFEATVREGGAWSVMGAYNRYLGEPCCASNLLLKDILRDTWGFKGYVVSDCGAIWDIYNGHNMVKTAAEASAMAVKAGCDLTCGAEYEALFEAIGKGMLKEEDIDRSVKRLMFARFKLGMFDPPSSVPYASIPYSKNDAPEHRALARRVAQESLVLLKNENATLPFRNNIRSIAVIGPTCDDVDVLLGNYNGDPSSSVTVLQGIRAKLGPSVKIRTTHGCNLAENMAPQLMPIPSRSLSCTIDGTRRAGLLGSYFPNRDLSGNPKVVRVDTAVDFTWGARAPIEGIAEDDFSIRWEGELRVEQTGKYVLGVTMDDGARLFLDDSLLLEDWKKGASRTTMRDVMLQAGSVHRIRLEYHEQRGRASIRFGWRYEAHDPLVEAMNAASESDVVVLVLGLSPTLEGEEMPVQLKGFAGGDRTDLALPVPQQRLLESVMKIGKPTALVLLNGSAVAITWADEHVPAILEAWYPGEEGGTAIADALFGDFNPGGRLPVTFYRSVKDLPSFDDYAMEGKTYRYFRGKALYPFGYGLSYTTFMYEAVETAKNSAGPSDTVDVLVKIRNTGSVAGDEVVQLYVQDPRAEAVRPIRALKAFKRVHLKAGEQQDVRLRLAMRDLRTYDEAVRDLRVMGGRYELQIGGSSANIRLKTEITAREK